MKLFSKLMMFVLVAALAAPFFLKGPGGRPLMTLQDLSLPSFGLPGKAAGPVEVLSGKDEGASIQWGGSKSTKNGVLVKATDTEGQLLQEARNTYYRWKDNEGVWQFTKQPNPNTENFLMKVDPNANIVQSLSQDSIDKAFGRQPKSETLALGEKAKSKNPLLPDEGSSIPFPSTIPIDQIPQLIDQAKGIQELSLDRQKTLDKL
ncbi:MAG: hypothetical protein KUG73_00590 [Pseudomonadales bacterium]|nr:hypothetical protein [Pseudomonadales bacterium]